jgi:hypothetical protein
MSIQNNEKINISGTYVRNLEGAKIVDGREVEGGYFVCETLPNWGTAGQLCYCTGDSKFYQYTGTTWEEKKFGTDAYTKNEVDGKIGGLTSDLTELTSELSELEDNIISYKTAINNNIEELNSALNAYIEDIDTLIGTGTI